ncbi:hypothetical protein BX666DRAFT_1980726 [Dichotomocladium elegans]|nr:hypothetical protein BX666DRAFT_1980726 [Dichotomocladium elegans]
MATEAATSQHVLQNVLSDPKLLRSFESYLRRIDAHQYLLFAETMSQLRYDYSKSPEVVLKRIHMTFFTPDSKYRLENISTIEQVNNDVSALQWVIIRREDAISVLLDSEEEVLSILRLKVEEFLRMKGIDITTIKHRPCKYQKHVVIVGGGFAGFTVASILDPMPLFHVTIIDTKDSFEYTPGIVKRLVNPSESSSMRVRHDAYVRNGRVIIGYATRINHGAKSILVNDETLFFDYLVIATGSSYASQLKSTDVSVLYRLTGLEQVHEELLNAKRVLVVGGGLVGCELSSEIALRTFPGPFPHKQVTLVDSHPKVISRSDSNQRDRAMRYLCDLGIEVVCNERIVDLDGSENAGVYRGSSGRVYSGYDMVFMATGTRPNSQLLQSSSELDCCVDSWGRICVKPTLQIDHWKYQHIFAGGDNTNVLEEKTGYAATLAGVCIARNICRLVKGKTPLRQGTKGTMPAPERPLHGIASQGGIGKQKLGMLKKKFAFLNPAWAALKLFDEQQYLKMVQGEALHSCGVIGKMPRRLTLPARYAPNYAPNLTAAIKALAIEEGDEEPVNLQQSQSSKTPSTGTMTKAALEKCKLSGNLTSSTSVATGVSKYASSSSSNLSSCTVSSSSSSSSSSSESIKSSSDSTLYDFLNNHFQFGGSNAPSAASSTVPSRTTSIAPSATASIAPSATTSTITTSSENQRWLEETFVPRHTTGRRRGTSISRKARAYRRSSMPSIDKSLFVSSIPL